MKIAIDASRSIDGIQKTGVEVVSDALLHAIEATRDDKHDYHYITPKLIPWLPKGKQLIRPAKRFWTYLGLSRELFRTTYDALIVPVHTLPFFYPKRTVKFIHDIASLKQPHLYSWFERALLRFDLYRTKNAKIPVIVPTNAIKRDLIGFLQWNPSLIHVCGWGPTSQPESVYQDVPKKKQLLVIGRIEAKKNIQQLIEGFFLFHQSHPDYQLILAGKPGQGYNDVKHLLHKEGVRELGYVTEEQKWQLLFESEALLMVSHEEGFSFPLLEAYQAELPTIISDIPTLTELSEGASYVTRRDPQAIAQAIERVVTSKDLQEQLVQKGRERLSHYSWRTLISTLLNILEQ